MDDFSSSTRSHPTHARALVIEDDLFSIRLVEQTLNEICFNYEIFKARDYKSAMDYIQQFNFDFIICDVFLEGNQNGIDFISSIEKLGYNVPTVFVSVLDPIKFQNMAKELKNDFIFLSKPFSKEKLKLSLIKTLCGNKN